MKIHVGDTVLVRLPVVGGQINEGDGVQVKPRVGVLTYLERGEVVSVEPRNIQVGDRVRRNYSASNPSGAVLAIVDGWAMVAWGPMPVVAPVKDLERV